MKDIIKKVIVGVLAVAVVLGAAIYRFFLYDPNKPQNVETQPTVVDAAGTTYYAVTDPNTGSTMVIVTNANGEQYKAEFDGQTVGGTTVPVSEGEVQGTLPSNYTGPHIDVSATTGSHQNSPQTTYSTTNPGTTVAQVPSSTAAPSVQDTTAPAGNRIDVYQTVFQSGNLLMEIEDEELGPVTVALKGNKMYLEASMALDETSTSNFAFKFIFNGDKKDASNPNGTWYMLIDSFKKYSTMPKDMIGDMDVNAMLKGLSSEGDTSLVYTTSYEDVDGVLLVCESTVDKNGNTLKHYFDGDVLVRSETISPDGSVSITKFSKISTNVPDSLFEIPSDYSYINLEWIMKLLGSAA